VVEERLRVAAVTAHDVEQKEQDSFDTNIASSHMSGITLFEGFPGDQGGFVEQNFFFSVLSF